MLSGIYSLVIAQPMLSLLEFLMYNNLFGKALFCNEINSHTHNENTDQIIILQCLHIQMYILCFFSKGIFLKSMFSFTDSYLVLKLKII